MQTLRMVAKTCWAMCWLRAFIQSSCIAPVQTPVADYDGSASGKMAPSQARLARPQAHQGGTHVPNVLLMHSGEIPHLPRMPRESVSLPPDFSLPMASYWCLCSPSGRLRCRRHHRSATSRWGQGRERRAHAGRIPPCRQPGPRQVSTRSHRAQPPQLRADIARLEGVLQGWQTATLPALRKQLEEALAKTKCELASRRSPGHTLDQAESRWRPQSPNQSSLLNRSTYTRWAICLDRTFHHLRLPPCHRLRAPRSLSP